MNVICYFNLIPHLKFSKQSQDLLTLWESTWRDNGWQPIILNEELATKNPLYNQLQLDQPQANFYKSINKKIWEYHRSCYCRLLAYCEYVRENGPTLYSDYDVINYGFTPSVLEHTEEDSYFLWDRSTVYLGPTGASEIEHAIKKFNDIQIKKPMKRGRSNDMRVVGRFAKTFKGKQDENGNWYSSRIMKTLNNKTPLVHFDGSICNIPKYKKNTRMDIINLYNKQRSCL